MFGKTRLLFISFMFSSIQSSIDFQCRIKEIRGLYDGFNKTYQLNSSNFEEVIFKEQKEKLWLVEFYKHWCSDCMKFVPRLKRLAYDIYEWRDTVTIGDIDCGNPMNTEVCQKRKIEKVPTLRIFNPYSDKHSLGINYGQEGNVTETDIRKKLACSLKRYHNNHGVIQGPVNLKLLFQSNLGSLWKDYPHSVQFLLLVFEKRGSLIGSQLALDLSRTKELRVRLVNPNNKKLYSVFRVKASENKVVMLNGHNISTGAEKIFQPKTLPFITVNFTEYTREDLNEVVRNLLRNMGVNVAANLPTIPPISINVTAIEIQEAHERERRLEKALNVSNLKTVVFQIDLEAAVNYIFKQEVSLMALIKGKPLNVLRCLVKVLVKYFPVNYSGKLFFEGLQRYLDRRDLVYGKDLKTIFTTTENEFKPFLPNPEWVGCNGTAPNFRGYPCTLWILFHTLTVLEEVHDPNGTPEVLNSMVGYIKYFFSCQICSEDFTKMAETIPGHVKTRRDAVMWLWNAHNQINEQLFHYITEDPLHPKVQFPTNAECSLCYDQNNTWDEAQVFNFLRHKHTKNIIYKDPRLLICNILE